jgi:hypothetical protein
VVVHLFLLPSHFVARLPFSSLVSVPSFLLSRRLLLDPLPHPSSLSLTDRRRLQIKCIQLGFQEYVTSLPSSTWHKLTQSKDNYASLAIWDSLGFQRVGLIPKAGRLKTGPNGEEEYVDAVVVWKSFVEEEATEGTTA